MFNRFCEFCVWEFRRRRFFHLLKSLSDPDNVLQSWDPTLVNPCTWFHITCNQDNRVTRVDLGNSNRSGHLVLELGS
ncbi:hypothetical protein Patl1_26197 [Pistacia atlantica]|uniref:Uncharacterized protein n=1 Tax=Pistacia atlantica TaxID=434234 RepID=A0ACC1B0P1_9ROSI|nr:hypothetical protein Patl1_26197 [Pistacia atlantica]